MVAPDKFALVMRWSDELRPEVIAERYMSDADLVICEGFKESVIPKVEVHRRSAHPEPLYLPGSEAASYYRAIVTDDAGVTAHVPTIRLGSGTWLEELAALVERDIMHR